MKVKKKLFPHRYFIIIPFLFLVLILLNIFFNTDKSLMKSSDIKLSVDKKSEYKGVILFNDSIAISSNCYSLQNNNLLIKHIPPPFYFRKKKNNDTILIIKNSDSLYFKFLP